MVSGSDVNSRIRSNLNRVAGVVVDFPVGILGEEGGQGEPGLHASAAPRQKADTATQGDLPVSHRSSRPTLRTPVGVMDEQSRMMSTFHRLDGRRSGAQPAGR